MWQSKDNFQELIPSFYCVSWESNTGHWVCMPSSLTSRANSLPHGTRLPTLSSSESKSTKGLWDLSATSQGLHDLASGMSALSETPAGQPACSRSRGLQSIPASFDGGSVLCLLGRAEAILPHKPPFSMSPTWA